jgi:hypothetical protein
MTPSRTSSNHADYAPFLAEGFAADEQTRLRAYELFRERGGIVGDDMGDWLRAEREYLELWTAAGRSVAVGRSILTPNAPLMYFPDAIR